MDQDQLREDRIRFRNRTLMVAVILLVVAAVVWLAFELSGILFMVFVSLFVAVAIEPPVHVLTKRGWRRGAATGVVFLVAFLLAVGFFVALWPLLLDQFNQFVDALPGYIEAFVQWLNETLDLNLSVGFEPGADTGSAIGDWLSNHAGGIVGGVVDLFGAIGGFFIFASTVAIFSFYIVAELPQLQRTVLAWMPANRQREALHIWDVAVEKMGGYIYSRLILAVLGGTFSTIFLTILDVPFALSLGIWVGVLSQFIPVVGTYLAAVLPAIVALSSGGTATMFWSIVYFVAYQQVENLLISPRITKRTMSIHPAVSIAAIIIGGNLLGAIGIILALPMTGIIQALISESSKRHAVILDTEQTGSPAPPGESVQPA